MTLRFNLGNYLQQRQITAYRLVSEVQGKVAPNTIYSLARKPAQRIDLKTVGEVLRALERLTGNRVEITDLLEEAQESAPANRSHLRFPPEQVAHDPTKKQFRYSGKGKPIDVSGGPSIVEIIVEGRGRNVS